MDNRHIWVFIKKTIYFPIKYYKCSICNIHGISVGGLTGFNEISIHELNLDWIKSRNITCEEFIIKNILE